MKHATIEQELELIERWLPRYGPIGSAIPEALLTTTRRLLQTLDGHNTAARADVAQILGVDDLKPKIGPQ